MTREAPMAAEDGRQGVFDPVARMYSAVFPAVWRYVTPGVRRWLTTRLADRHSILDAGTGSGYWLRVLHHDRPRTELVGLDISPTFLRIAAQSTPEARFVLADMSRSGLAADHFDAVVCAGVLDTLPDVESALRELARVTAQGALVALVLRGRNKAVSAALEALFRWTVGVFRSVHERNPAKAQVSTGHWVREPLLPRLRSLADAARLEIVEVAAGPLVSCVLLRQPGGGNPENEDG